MYSIKIVQIVQIYIFRSVYDFEDIISSSAKCTDIANALELLRWS